MMVARYTRQHSFKIHSSGSVLKSVLRAYSTTPSNLIVTLASATVFQKAREGQD
jgi:hypothetical protein